jgi:UDP-N-acetylglucosamine--N-acetylmuramyl-(pentapeptide) pyrophosphoryl-undecaprenol N-acetylglucosamine transferase
MKILISGGHLTPALAVIDYIQAHHPEDEVVFVGRLYSQDKLKQQSQEYNEITKRNIEFVTFSGPRLRSPQVIDRARYVSTMLPSIWRAIQVVKDVNPDVYLSFGSYVAVPFAIAAAIHKVPIVTHEQTRAVGEATKFIARFAQKIAISHESSRPYLPSSKVVVTGNPIRTQLFKKQSRPEWIKAEPKKPVLFITGGNQGSEILNTIVQQSLRQLVKQWFVIHQCGGATSHRNYLRELEQTQGNLPQTVRGDYVAKEWVSESELGWIYQNATAVVARSGANTTQELAAMQLPAILIPLPFAHYDEQTLNAKWLSEGGGAILLPQKELNPETLVAQTQKVGRYSKSMRQKLKQFAVLRDGSEKVYQLLRSVARH